MRRLFFVVAVGALGAAALVGQTPAPTPTPRIFDPRRPPERELETGIADGFTLAAVGDLIISRPLTQTLPNDPGFAAVVRILQGADAAFGNFETTVVDPARVVGHPYPGQGDVSLVAEPAAARDLVRMGFDVVSRANNHSMDWGVEGMRETTRVLDEAGLVHAGVGENRGEARAARYLETASGRVALVSMASTFSEHAPAMAPRGRAPGRPGLSPLRVTRSFVLTKDSMQQLRALKDTLGAPALRCEVSSPSTLESRKKAEREASERGPFPGHGIPRGKADGRALRDGPRRSRRGPPGDSPGQAAFGPAHRDHPFPRHRPRLRRARRLPAGPGARGDRRRRRHLHRARRAPPDADRDLQGTTDLLQPRQLLLERHPRAHPGRDVRVEPRPSRRSPSATPAGRPMPTCSLSGTPAASTIRGCSKPSSP